MRNEPQYYYQRFEWKPIQLGKRVDVPDWDIFLSRIRMPDKIREDFSPSQQYILDNFSTHILGNIHWYEKKVVRENNLRLGYILVSLTLLLLIPLLVAIIEEKTQSISAEIAAIFTGFFALYQGFSRWLESRNGISVYWQTKSNLKSRLYSLEDKWISFSGDGGEWTTVKLEELANDLREATLFGMESVRTEKQLFFARYRYPQFNILSTILGVRSQINTLFQRQPGKGDSRSTERTAVDASEGAQAKLAQLTEEADKPTAALHAEVLAASEAKRLHLEDAKIFLGYRKPPYLVTRSDWGAKPHKKDRYPLGAVKSMVIHHAAGYWGENDNNQEDGKAHVLEIQELHQEDRGWSDIGYHFLIDPLGNLYQGRAFMDDSVPLAEGPSLIIGAHVHKNNTGRIGICLLGNYQTEGTDAGDLISPPAEETLVHLLTYLHLVYKPLGDTHSTVRSETIVGHRDFKATSCPGSNLYKHFKTWRARVEQALTLLRESE